MDTYPFTLVVGLGKTGLSCARFLANAGIPFSVTDSRQVPPGLKWLRDEFPSIPVSTGKFSSELLARAQQVVLSPGISLSEPFIQEVIQRGIPVIGDIELFVRHTHSPIVAITGSNGKSTVTTLVGEMAQYAGCRVGVGGNLGTPALDLINYQQEPDLYVLELSSFQLETTHNLNAKAAVVLNISPDHLDRHGDLTHYTALKKRVYQGNGTMIINADDPFVSVMEIPDRNTKIFTLEKPTDQTTYGILLEANKKWIAKGNFLLMPVENIRMAGRHNVANALAALALADAVNLPMAPCLKALCEFSGLPHRCQFVKIINGVTWYNDSKGTNVGATEAACAGLDGPLILIAGGLGKGQDFRPLGTALKGKTRRVILIGEDASKISAAIEGIVPVEKALDLRSAVIRAHALAQFGDQVLLSPACASFDMFHNYEDRGEKFMQEVHRLTESDSK